MTVTAGSAQARRRRVPAGLVLLALAVLWGAGAVEAASQPRSVGGPAIGLFLLVMLAAGWVVRVAWVWGDRHRIRGRWWPLAAAPAAIVVLAVSATTTTPFDLRWSGSRDDFARAVTEIEAGRDPGTLVGTRLGRYPINSVDRTPDGHLRFFTTSQGATFIGFTHATSPPDESTGHFSYEPLEGHWYRMAGV